MSTLYVCEDDANLGRRQPKHDAGSVQNVVTAYIRQRQVLRSGGESRGRDANSNKKKQKKK